MNASHTARSRLIGVLLVTVLALAIDAFAPAHAGTASMSCTAPTLNTNGTPIAAGAVITYKFYRGSSATAVASSTTPIGSATTCAFTDAAAPDGQTVFYAVSATVNGVESAKTGAVSVAIPNPTPNPPSGLTVTAVVAGLNMNPVYRINADGSRGTAVLGFVPVGSPCSGPLVFTYRGKPYHRVDPVLVKWEATSPTLNAATACKTA